MKSGCGSRVEKWLIQENRSTSIEHLQSEMCSNLFIEALSLSNSTFSDKSPFTKKDLFLQMRKLSKIFLE